MNFSNVSFGTGNISKSDKKSSLRYGLGVAVPTIIGAGHGICRVVDKDVVIVKTMPPMTQLVKVCGFDGKVQLKKIYTKPPKEIKYLAKAKGLKPIYAPFIFKLTNAISKLPKGEKLSSFLRSTPDSWKKIKNTKFAYNKTLMLKGAGFMFIPSLIIAAAIKGRNSENK